MSKIWAWLTFRFSPESTSFPRRWIQTTRTRNVTQLIRTNLDCAIGILSSNMIHKHTHLRSQLKDFHDDREVDGGRSISSLLCLDSSVRSGVDNLISHFELFPNLKVNGRSLFGSWALFHKFSRKPSSSTSCCQSVCFWYKKCFKTDKNEEAESERGRLLVLPVLVKARTVVPGRDSRVGRPTQLSFEEQSNLLVLREGRYVSLRTWWFSKLRDRRCLRKIKVLHMAILLCAFDDFYSWYRLQNFRSERM